MTDIDLRPISEADLEEVLALHRRSEAFDQIPRVLEMEELADDLNGPEADLSTDSRLALVDGVPVGYAHTLYLPSPVRLERCYLLGIVDPAYRQRKVGRTLMGWAMGRASEQLRSSGSDLPKYVRVDQYDFVTSAHRLFARMGFAPVRYHEQLLRPLSDLPAPRSVNGVSILPWPEQRSHEIREVKNTAFADHWGSTPTTVQRWDQKMASSTTKPDLSFIAVDEKDNVVGYCINDRYEADDELMGRREGWIGNVGTLRSHRNRGIASALIVESLHAFVNEGLSHAMLGVDSESPSGAGRLYRKLGFEPFSRTITHEIEVGSGWP